MDSNLYKTKKKNSITRTIMEKEYFRPIVSSWSCPKADLWSDGFFPADTTGVIRFTCCRIWRRFCTISQVSEGLSLASIEGPVRFIGILACVLLLQWKTGHQPMRKEKMHSLHRHEGSKPKTGQPHLARTSWCIHTGQTASIKREGQVWEETAGGMNSLEG